MFMQVYFRLHKAASGLAASVCQIRALLLDGKVGTQKRVYDPGDWFSFYCGARLLDDLLFPLGELDAQVFDLHRLRSQQ